ncbi:hypothetical protein Scep_026063 [Stephania cephalantha]|uniref:Uncharacterized protein n=1 Tax=Stephania cephalantha TaxID=152367 RepID=A0AAP0EJU8_9MAGN
MKASLELLRMDQVNMAGLELDVLPEKTITDEVIKRHGRVNGYENTEDERELRY